MTLDRRASSLRSLDIKLGMLLAGGTGGSAVTLAILAKIYKMLVTVRNTRVRYIQWLTEYRTKIRQYNNKPCGKLG
jgi:hypothetical protein